MSAMATTLADFFNRSGEIAEKKKKKEDVLRIMVTAEKHNGNTHAVINMKKETTK